MLVVGASATGVQLADEIQRSGRAVTLAVGEHVRLPRTYRGRDVFWWMDAAGVLDERYDEVDDLVRARHLPSPQLIGTPERRSIDLNSLPERGVRIVGRLGRIRDGVAQFSGSLPNVCQLADLKMNRLLATARRVGRRSPASTTTSDRPSASSRPAPRADSDSSSTSSVTASARSSGRPATAPTTRWLDLPVFDRKGRIRHDGGVVTRRARRLPARGQRCCAAAVELHRRRRPDTADLAAHLHEHLDSKVLSLR